MRYRDLADIAFKIFGVFWLAKAATNIVQMLLVLQKLGVMSSDRLGPPDIIGWGFLVLLYAVLGFFLTFRTKTIIQAMKLEEGQTTSIETKDAAATYQRLGLFLLGVFFTVPALSSLIPQIIKLWSYKTTAPEFPNMYQDAYLLKEWPRIVENGIQFLLGLGLIIGGDKLTTIWKRLRPLANEKERDSAG